jgi:hypothetical protein
MILPLRHPFCKICAGPTSCGKTEYTFRLLKHANEMIDTKIEQIVWIHGQRQPLHEKIKNEINIPIIFYDEIISLDEIAPESRPPPRLVIIDDMMNSINGQIVKIFSQGSHHRNLSVIFITQNIFNQSKGNRDISLNCHYIVLFKNPRDRQQIYSFSRQVFPTKSKFLLSAFDQATEKPHTYLLFDFRQETQEILRFRTQIFPDDKENIFFIPQEKLKGDNMIEL